MTLKDALQMHLIAFHLKMQVKCIFNDSEEKVMRLTRYTDYSLRVLMFVGARGDHVSTIAEIARAYDISRDHLMKVVQQLGSDGYLRNVRGRSGGLLLARAASDIVVGDVVRRTELDFDLVECGSCAIKQACKLTGAMGEALDAFMAVLDRYTLEDLLSERSDLMQLFGLYAHEGPPLKGEINFFANTHHG
jgi:Rrf2 family transcriptional regulator, nitric oxide-sensitive transcriptional repressor